MNEEIIVNGMNKINKRKYESLSQSNIVYNDFYESEKVFKKYRDLLGKNFIL